MNYLQREKRERGIDDRFKIMDLERRFTDFDNDIRQNLFKSIQNAVSEGDAEEIKSAVIRSIEEQASKAIVMDVEKRLKEEIAGINHIGAIRRMHDGMIRRLSLEIDSLGRRANVNLAFGSATSVAGLAILAYLAFAEKHSTPNTNTQNVELAIRFSLVVFIEIFSYFFLNLYRYGIFEIKYFQNEITNATFKTMSLETAILQGDATSIRKICDDLIKTERNFILKKNETTLELKRAEMFMQNEKTLGSMVERIFKTAGRESRNGDTTSR